MPSTQPSLFRKPKGTRITFKRVAQKYPHLVITFKYTKFPIKVWSVWGLAGNPTFRTLADLSYFLDTYVGIVRTPIGNTLKGVGSNVTCDRC